MVTVPCSREQEYYGSNLFEFASTDLLAGSSHSEGLHGLSLIYSPRLFVGYQRTGFPSKSRNPDPKEGLGYKSRNPDSVLCGDGNRLFASHGCGKGKYMPNQNLRSLSPQKRKTDYGCLFPSRFQRGAIASTDLLRMEVDLASIAAVDSGVPDVTGKIGSVGVVNPGVHDLDLSGSQVPDLNLDHQKYIKTLPPAALSGNTKLMAKSRVPEPVLKSLPMPATGSLGLFSAGFPLSRGYGTSFPDQCEIVSRVRVFGSIGTGDPALAKYGEVLDFCARFWFRFRSTSSAVVPALATTTMGERISVSLWVSLRYAQYSSDLSQFRLDLVTSVFNEERIGDGGEASFLVFPLFGASFGGRPECHFGIKIAQIWLDMVRRFFQSGWKLTDLGMFFNSAAGGFLSPIFKIHKTWVPDLGLHSAPKPNGILVLDFQPLRPYLGSTMLGFGLVDESIAIAANHTGLGAVGIASNADATSVATGSVRDAAVNAFKGDLSANSDFQRNATLSSVLDRFRLDSGLVELVLPPIRANLATAALPYLPRSCQLGCDGTYPKKKTWVRWSFRRHQIGLPWWSIHSRNFHYLWFDQ